MSTRGLIRCVALAVILMLSSEASAVVALQETQPEAEVTATAEEDARSSDDSQVSPTEMPAEKRPRLLLRNSGRGRCWCGGVWRTRSCVAGRAELIFIDPDAIETSGNACLEAEIATGSVQIRPVVTDLWADDNLAVDIVVDLEFDPDVLRWTFAGGSSVVAVIVGDQGRAEVAANLFDYREFAGAVAGDAGLNAPFGDPGSPSSAMTSNLNPSRRAVLGRVAMPMKRQPPRRASLRQSRQHQQQEPLDLTRSPLRLSASVEWCAIRSG